MLFQLLQDDLLLLLLHEWMKVADLVSIDIAFCQRELRSRYLAVTKTVAQEIATTSNSFDAFMRWKDSRNFAVKKLSLKVTTKQTLIPPFIPELTAIFIQSAIQENNFFSHNVISIHLDQFLQRLPSIEYVMFQGESSGDQNIHIHTTTEGTADQQQSFPQLKELHIHACEFRDDIDLLGNWLGRSLPTLTKFSIVECLYIFSNDFIPKILSKLSSKLSSLRFHNARYDFEDHLLTDLPNQLDLLRNPSFPSDLNLSGPLQNIQELEICGYWHITEFKDLSNLLKVCSGVKSLSLFRMMIDYAQRYNYFAALLRDQLVGNKPQLEQLVINVMLRDDTYFIELDGDMEEEVQVAGQAGEDPFISRRQLLSEEVVDKMVSLKALNFVKFSNVNDEILVRIAQKCIHLENIGLTMLGDITEEGIVRFCEQFGGDRNAVHTISIQSCPLIRTSKGCIAIFNTFPCLINFFYDPAHVSEPEEQAKIMVAMQEYQAAKQAQQKK